MKLPRRGSNSTRKALLASMGMLNDSIARSGVEVGGSDKHRGLEYIT